MWNIWGVEEGMENDITDALAGGRGRNYRQNYWCHEFTDYEVCLMFNLKVEWKILIYNVFHILVGKMS